jgi:hypothetical protein
MLLIKVSRKNDVKSAQNFLFAIKHIQQQNKWRVLNVVDVGN